MKANLIITLTIMLLVWLSPTTAKTYRWVDEKGHTVYSQSRPPSGKATVIKPPPPPASEPDETMKKLKAKLGEMEEERKQKKEAKDKKKKAEDDAEAKKRNCEIAKANLAAIEQHARVRMKTDDGNYKMLSNEERTAALERTKKEVKKHCK